MPMIQIKFLDTKEQRKALKKLKSDLDKFNKETWTVGALLRKAVSDLLDRYQRNKEI